MSSEPFPVVGLTAHGIRDRCSVVPSGDFVMSAWRSVVVFLMCGFVLAGSTVGLASDGKDPASPQQREQREVKSRRFEFDYGATVTGLPPGARVRVWMPVPPSDAHQMVEEMTFRLPATPQISVEPKYGNRVLYFEQDAVDESLAFSTSHLITRREVRGLETKAGGPLSAEQRRGYLAPDAKVPVGGKPLELLTGLKLSSNPVEIAKTKQPSRTK